MQINGAGATFPYPIYSKWFSEYNKLHPNVADQLPVDRIGRRHPAGDQPDGVLRRDRRTDDQRSAAAAPGKILHFPTVLGADRAGLQHSRRQRASSSSPGAVLADIFLGKITKWNDPAIAKLNPGVKLPATDITVVHRSDGSGTTYIWVDYLSKVSPEWKTQGRRRHGGELAGRRRRQGQRGCRRPGDADAGLDRLRRADLRAAEQDQLRHPCRTWPANSSRRPSTSVTAAAAAAAAARCRPTSACRSPTRPGKGVYPISSFTWLLLYENPKDKSAGEDHGRLREVGADRRPEVLPPASATRRCRMAS